MCSRSVHYRQTRKRGKIIKQVAEKYLRNDLGFGICYTAHEQGEVGDDIRDDNEELDIYEIPSQRKRKSRSYPKLNSQVDQIVGRPYVIPTAQELISKWLISPSDSDNPYIYLVVVDTNVLLHNLDVLEKAVLGGGAEDAPGKSGSGAGLMPNIVIPQTALLECRANRLTAYDRCVNLLRSIRMVAAAQSKPSDNEGKSQQQQSAARQYCPILFPDRNHAATAIPSIGSSSSTSPLSINDENDRSIRCVAHYLAESTRGTNVRVILLTDDKNCREKAKEESSCLYQAHSVASWMKILEQSNTNIGYSLSDLVANFHVTGGGDAGNVESKNDNHLSSPNSIEQYTAHLASTDLSRGMQQGKYHRGTFRVVSQAANGRDRVGSVTIRQGDERVAVTVNNQEDTNRAIDGDIVAISIHPVDQWSKGQELKSDVQNASSDDGALSSKDNVPASTAAGIMNDTADPTPADLENVADTIAVQSGTGETDLSLMRPAGKVVGIIRRSFSSYSGSIFETSSSSSTPEVHGNGKEKHSVSSDRTEREEIASKYEREHEDGTFTCVFFPVDRKVPPILIRTTQRDRMLRQRIVVAMDSWPAHSSFPLGHYVRTIGPAGSKDVETQVLLQEQNIPHEPFPAAVLACLPPDDYKIGADSSGRLDLRHLPVLSIDPPNCKDIDDALHCMKLPNGNYQIGVHIADVSHYVKPGTAIDLEASDRSTSTYLVNRRLDMLPSLLTTDLCSLKGNLDRYAFSVLWEVTDNAIIVDVQFHKTLIHSIGALTYQQAQSLIDQPDDPNDVHACAVKRLAMLARKFRKKRIDAGALTLASPEVKFVLDSESLNPTDVQAYALLEANAVVEELHYPTMSVLRRHPAPNRAMFDSLISKAKCKGLSIDIDDSKHLADSLDAAQVESDPYINKLLRILSTRCMSPAQYFCSGEFPPTEWHHYGLAAPVYTHFTSPIRR